jgi:ubiquinone/menaquinone biosynthesis C-methylase UbiE
MKDDRPDPRDRGIPNRFPPADKGYALYDDVEYREHWEGSHQARQDALERHIISDMLPASGRRIIDLGCGYGRLAPIYLDRFDQSVLFDGSFALLRDARDTLGDRAILVAGDLGSLPFTPSSFDCVLTIRVLQHLRELPSALEGIRRIIARDGSMVFSYYNKRNAHRILHYLKARKVGDPFSPEPAEISPTMIAQHPTRFGQLLGSARLSPPEYRGAVVVDSLASITDRFGGHGPAGAKWAPFMGRFRLAPWLIGRSFAEVNGSLPTTDSSTELFECPICHGQLNQSDKGLECFACQRGYPIDDGIYDFRL